MGYLTDQIITYIGNKRKLLDFIDTAVCDVKKELNKPSLSIFDGFSGTGIVARKLKSHANFLVTNDLEKYSHVVNTCYLANKSEVDSKQLNDIVSYLNEVKTDKIYDRPGIIESLYCPEDESNIKEADRVFYTKENARIIDNIRRLQNDNYTQDYNLFSSIIGPLLSEASDKVNTCGVFLGFFKDKNTGVGKYGGTTSKALKRIKGTINLSVPILSDHECECVCLNDDTNSVVKSLKHVDLAYYDPPYNRHSYGANYFMLNIITDYEWPLDISRVSGVPKDWNRSMYYKKAESKEALINLIDNTNAKYILLSYSNEGYIPFKEMTDILNSFGKVRIYEKSHRRYNTHVSKMASRPEDFKTKTKEYLFLVKKGKIC
tara:strand:+ start:1253 stop:2377 length:1125 start_codon:yes stop_codon:yes gene_type:complete